MQRPPDIKNAATVCWDFWVFKEAQMLADILSKIVPAPGMKDAEMAASVPAAVKGGNNLRADVLAGAAQPSPKGGIGGYAAGQTDAGNYRPSLLRPIEKIAKVLPFVL